MLLVTQLVRVELRLQTLNGVIPKTTCLSVHGLCPLLFQGEVGTARNLGQWPSCSLEKHCVPITCSEHMKYSPTLQREPGRIPQI